MAFDSADYESLKRFWLFPFNSSGASGLANILTPVTECCSDIKGIVIEDNMRKRKICGCAICNNMEVPVKKSSLMPEKVGCCDDVKPVKQKEEQQTCGCSDNPLREEVTDAGCGCVDLGKPEMKKTFFEKLFGETLTATTMVIKFMILAYFLEAIIIFYVPSHFITTLLGTNHFFSIISAAIIGVPVYTSSMPALALVGGLISQGMSPAAGLAFLISGPTTTIPAMAAVWNLASKKVFTLYVGFTLVFAIISGLLFYAVYSII